MNTIITEKTENGEASFDIFSKLVDSRILFLYDYIDDKTATDIVATLLYLDHIDDKKKISLYINSEGGDVRSIFMIYDIMKIIHAPIETFCIGSACGESILILAAGTKGLRYATKSSTLCINQLYHVGHRYSDMTNAKISLEQSKKDNEKFMTALSECTKKTLKKISKDSERQLFMSPEDAKKYSIIDEVVKGSK